MTEFGSVTWPPAPIKTERLVLRGPEARDRSALIELFTSPEVGTYIGGPQPRDEFERAMAEVPAWRPGLFVVDLGGAMIGFLTLLDRRDAGRPGHVRPEAGEAELGYMFLPQAWGHGYAHEACVAALAWFDGALPGEPLVLCTQIANDRAMRLAAKLGFTEVERFEEYGAEQWFGVRSSVTPSALLPLGLRHPGPRTASRRCSTTDKTTSANPDLPCPDVPRKRRTRVAEDRPLSQISWRRYEMWFEGVLTLCPGTRRSRWAAAAITRT